MSEADQQRMWTQVQLSAHEAIDRIDAAPGFMEPQVRIHVSTVIWLAERLAVLQEPKP